ncbi:4'-phosphopantetheinyl transferase [Streptomyces sioyaensis]|uniref:4'-phosphopantetheinyl transferase n=1 Tax=Streptomyces sioyaensis TaxID=67364 RepID=UPI003790BB56
MIGDVVAEPVSWSDAVGDPPGPALHPAEESAVRNALPGRRAEFTTGRHCAHRALERLGAAADAIPRGPRGAPQWPAGVVGSITHCDGYRAAAVARTAHAGAVGIDAEPNLPLPDGVLGRVALPQEEVHLAALRAQRPGVCWDRLLFSAKESVYKVGHALTDTPLRFDEASLVFEPRSGTFRARILRSGVPGPELAGRWSCRGGLLVTAITVPAMDRRG